MSYSLANHYAGTSLLDGFNFWDNAVNGTDPSGGYVVYQGYEDAYVNGLWGFLPGDVLYLSADPTETLDYNTDAGRGSTRIQSQMSWNHGLVIADFAHMPSSACGVWPAFWMYGPMGEIDIIEGSNNATTNIMSAHTADGCTLPMSGFSGTVLNDDCGMEGGGCNVLPPDSDTNSYGDPFNGAAGGIYAVEWTATDIKIWHWDRASVPQNIIDGEPDPSTWMTPQALFGTSSCDPDTYFKDMSIVLDIDFCGNYAGSTWNSDMCNTLETEGPQNGCVKYVAEHPDAFVDAYWSINYIDVYQLPAGSNGTGPYSNTTTSRATSTMTQTVTATSGTSTPGGGGGGPMFTPTSSSCGPSPSEVAAMDALVAARELPTIGNYTFLGCYGSAAGYPTFELAVNASATGAMTPTLCVQACAAGAHKYAGIFSAQCYCADALSADVQQTPHVGACDVPCPADPSQFCGGYAAGSGNGAAGTCAGNMTIPGGGMSARRRDNTSPAGSRRGVPAKPFHLPQSPAAEKRAEQRHWLGARAADPTILLIIYADLSEATPTPPPAMNPPAPTGALVTETLTSTVTYTTVCATNPAVLVVVEYCTTMTLTHCGCATAPPPPQVPLTTQVAACSACAPGGGSVVTLTVPIAVVATQAPVQTKAYYQAGAQRIGGGAGPTRWTAALAGVGGLVAAAVMAGAGVLGVAVLL